VTTIPLSRNKERLLGISRRLDEARARNHEIPEWGRAMFLLTGLTSRLDELGLMNDEMEGSIASLLERAVDGGPPL